MAAKTERRPVAGLPARSVTVPRPVGVAVLTAAWAVLALACALAGCAEQGAAGGEGAEGAEGAEGQSGSAFREGRGGNRPPFREVPAEAASRAKAPSPVFLPQGPARPRDPGANRPRVAPSPSPDIDYRGDEPVEVIRLVYRVTFRVPAVLGDPPGTLPRPTAELHVDVSEDRLRARFSGPGWPVGAGSVVRIRRDLGGAYVFDGDGGRHVGPGMLAAWFQGGSLGRAQPAVGVRRAPSAEQEAPGDLICVLLAEWSSRPRTELERRCGEGGAPLVFRIGAWRAQRTAEVPVQLPRSAMSADHTHPPAPISPSSSRPFMEPSVLARVPLSRRVRRGEVLPPPTGSVRVQNNGPTRIVVTVGGMPVGWVDRGAIGFFEGLVPGEHTVGAMRPLGGLALSPHRRDVPFELRIRPPRPRP